MHLFSSCNYFAEINLFRLICELRVAVSSYSSNDWLRNVRLVLERWDQTCSLMWQLWQTNKVEIIKLKVDYFNSCALYTTRIVSTSDIGLLLSIQLDIVIAFFHPVRSNCRHNHFSIFHTHTRNTISHWNAIKIHIRMNE